MPSTMRNVNPESMENVFVSTLKEPPVLSGSQMKIQQNLENALWRYEYISKGALFRAEWPKMDKFTDFGGLQVNSWVLFKQ